jgi:hypothetical protein
MKTHFHLAYTLLNIAHDNKMMKKMS